jgi:hypothetical protein
VAKWQAEGWEMEGAVEFQTGRSAKGDVVGAAVIWFRKLVGAEAPR